jgi:hypothetical protein
MNDIPYVNQLDNAPRGNDCGPACVAMLTGSVDPALATAATVTDLSKRFDVAQDGTTARDLVRMGEYLGIDLVADTSAPFPCISLVDYKMLPRKYQVNGDFGHWIVRLSDTVYHDPLYRGDRGANIVTTKAVLNAAEQAARRWSSTIPNRVRLKTTMTQTSGKALITATERFRVRSAPSTSSGTLTGYWLQPGQLFDVLGTTTAERYTWGKVSVTAGSVVVGDGWVRGDGWRFVNTPTPPQPQPPTPVQDWQHAKYLLGVSCLNDGDAGMDALARGCRSVLFMDNLMGAAAAARQYPDAIIAARFWFQNAPDPAWLADHAGAGLANIPSNMWTTCANECDWICYGTPDELRRRFEYERAFCNAMWAKNPSRKLVIGEFSHGTPDITNPAIVQTFKETYYAFAQQNAGRVRIGWHLYTKGKRFADAPPAQAEIDAPEWYEGRDASFWTQCGASKSVVHFCGETGVEAGSGGFAWAGYSDEQFARWCSWWLDYRRSRPVVLNGACIFQFGYHPNWQGYDVRRFAGVLEDFWKGRRS